MDNKLIVSLEQKTALRDYGTTLKPQPKNAKITKDLLRGSSMCDSCWGGCSGACGFSSVSSCINSFHGPMPTPNN